MPILINIFYSIIFLQQSTCFNSQTDLHSLLAIKSAITNDPLGALDSWNETTSFCGWNGIRCGLDRVVGINLMSQGLVGSLSPHVGNLSFLTTLHLQNNTFHGPIPHQIGLLTRLQSLILENNSFVGPIPKTISQCWNLLHLSLSDNELSDNIPSELGSLSKLEVLVLARNNLHGPIPPSIGNLTSLEEISLLTCGLTGEIPASFSQLQSLIFVQLSDNYLTGTIPSSLFNISTIKYFYAAGNELSGILPSNLGITLPNLEGLYLWGNNFSGPIPFSISNASFLAQIDLSLNYFIGKLPRVGGLTLLQSFIFESNLLVDDTSFISSLINSTKLEAIGVGGNKLRGSLPDSIANLSTRLSMLHIEHNRIYGRIPIGIGNLIGLTSIDISYNDLHGPIPTTIGKLSSLILFDARANRLTGALPPSFGNLTSLSTLHLSENRFWGYLPSSLGGCTDLMDLDLSYNNFSGLIPQEIMSLSSLSITFNFSYNNFKGSIPDEVGLLWNLGTLDFSHNRFSGLIPESLGQCRSLEKLYLEENLLQGGIPAGMSALKGLQDLDLSRNNLSGAIPDFLGILHLERLNLSFNRLQGEVPTMGVFKNKSLVSVDGNSGLCGGIPELKLPPCSVVESHKRKQLSTMLKILIPTLVVVGVGITFLITFIALKQRRSRTSVTSQTPFTGIEIIRLSYKDLIKATGGFCEANMLGFGRFGSVYKGILEDGQQTQVAVKVINLSVRGASKSFFTECNSLRNVRHRNVLKILSVCESVDFQGNEFKGLVYEFKANGSLEKWLHHSDETSNLDLIQRLNISIDVAQALEYLHIGMGSCIVHGDLKPSNILLDDDMIAYVGDFGLAKIISDMVSSHESSLIGIAGTLGYVAPGMLILHFIKKNILFTLTLKITHFSFLLKRKNI
ncbi:probable LRR receptor-like serine/threonine-protein kinase At3g47570 [Salvia miltiorrhiza]|uniref:probable LRR receptor-like serine/threonine-protein kinase At3g47570 n=1 Tax=Salvia miltiorrhiza TaxID=226208 RepID=UPI0025AB8A33|nr:probable LRR receptor-like serine/threonine-protein kinase At3g47570 [Salvia miltiorrhiza]